MHFHWVWTHLFCRQKRKYWLQAKPKYICTGWSRESNNTEYISNKRVNSTLSNTLHIFWKTKTDWVFQDKTRQKRFAKQQRSNVSNVLASLYWISCWQTYNWLINNSCTGQLLTRRTRWINVPCVKIYNVLAFCNLHKRQHFHLLLSRPWGLERQANHNVVWHL